MGNFLSYFTREKRDANVQSTDEITSSVGLSFLSGIANRDAMSLSAVFAAVELISSSLAGMSIHVKDIASGLTLPNHYIYNALNNNLLTPYMLIKQLVSDVLLHGNGFAYITRGVDGTPLSIRYCPNGQCSIYYNEQTGNLKYRVNFVSKYVEPCDMIHFIKYSKNGIEGIGVIRSANDIINTVVNTENAASEYFKNGMKVDGILSSTKPLNEKQKWDIRENWNRLQRNGNGLLILGSDMQYQSIGTNSTDAQMLESRLYNTAEVARIFGVSPVLLQDLSKSTFSTIEGAQLDFIIHCLTPFIKMIEQELSRKLLLPSEQSKYKIDVCEEELLKADKAATSNYLSTLTNAGIMTVNEARHIIGLTPVDGGDVCRIPYSDAAQNEIGNTNITNDTNE